MATILPKKDSKTPVATDDEAHVQLVNDPTIPQFMNTTQSVADNQFNSFQNNQSVPATGTNTVSYPVYAPRNLVANDNTHWINTRWRPAMGWMYMATCIADFIVFPILWSILQAVSKGQVTSQWKPLTLEGAGLFHIAMGAVLGITAYGRTKEKTSGVA